MYPMLLAITNFLLGMLNKISHLKSARPRPPHTRIHSGEGILGFVVVGLRQFHEALTDWCDDYKNSFVNINYLILLK